MRSSLLAAFDRMIASILVGLATVAMRGVHASHLSGSRALQSRSRSKSKVGFCTYSDQMIRRLLRLAGSLT